MKTSENITFKKDIQYYKFCTYGFLKNQKFFDPFLLLFFLEKNFSYTEIGFLLMIREITTNIFEIPTGIIADSFGRRRSLMLSFSLYITSFLIYYFSETYTVLILASLFFAFGDAFRTGTHKAMIFEYLKIKGWKSQKVHYYGHTRSYSQLGSAISSLIAAAIVFFNGRYADIFLFSTIPYIFDFLLIMSYPKSLDGQLSKFDFMKLSESFNKVFREFIVSFKEQSILRSIANTAVHSGYYKAVKDYLQPILQTLALSLPIFIFYHEKERTALIVGIVYFSIYFVTSFASRNSGLISELFKSLHKPLNITLVAGFILGAVCGILVHFSFLIIAIILYIGIYINENLRKPMGIAHITETIKDDILASTLSASSQVDTLVAAISAPLIGFIADSYGVGIALLTLSVLLLCIFPFIRVKQKNKLNNE